MRYFGLMLSPRPRIVAGFGVLTARYVAGGSVCLRIMRGRSITRLCLLGLIGTVGAACGGSGPSTPSPSPMPAPPPPINGMFGGGGSATSSLGTDARASVSIEITNNVVTNLSIPWRTASPPGSPATFCAGSVSVANLTLAPNANTFSRDIDSVQYATRVEGNVVGDNVRGMLTVTGHPGNVPAYCASATIPWAATKGESPTPLQ